MPKYYEEQSEESSKPKLACSGLREDLKECLLKSDCVVKASNQAESLNRPYPEFQCHFSDFLSLFEALI